MGSYSVLCFVIHIILAASAVVVVAQDFGSDFGSADGSSFDADTSVLSLSGSGTTNPSKLLWRVFNTIEDQAGSPIRVTYRAVGSGTGIKEFVGGRRIRLRALLGLRIGRHPPPLSRVRPALEPGHHDPADPFRPRRSQLLPYREGRPR